MKNIKFLVQNFLAAVVAQLTHARSLCDWLTPLLHNGAGLFVLAAIFPLILSSCKPQVSVKASSANEALVFFSTGFSQSTAKTLKNLTGTEPDSSLFNKEDILAILESVGAKETSVAIPNPTEVSATGTVRQLAKNPLSTTGLITKTKNSLTLAIGPRQITTFYALLNDEAKSYLDLMMIPALIGEKMSLSEYRELLASMYGPTFASEIVNGKLTISLSSPDGKSSLKEEISLGELLCADEEKVWTLRF